MKINCPKCHEETEFFLNEALDENGEVYKCKNCGYLFRYTKK